MSVEQRHALINIKAKYDQNVSFNWEETMREKRTRGEYEKNNTHFVHHSPNKG